MKYFTLLSLLILFSCTSNVATREEQIMIKAINNSYTDNWELNKKNRSRILKFDISPEEHLWNACNTVEPLEVIYHLKTLDILDNFYEKKWAIYKNNFREKALDNLTNELSKKRLEALQKIMIFGELQDIQAVAHLLTDEQRDVRMLAKGTLVQLSAPFRIELINEENIDKLKKFTTFYLNWYEENKEKNREDILWQRLQQTLPSHYKQTVTNGLIAMLSTKSNENKQFYADTLWPLIQKEVNINVRNQLVILLGVLKNTKYIQPLLDTGWLSNGSLASRARVSWALNQMSYPNPQPYK